MPESKKLVENHGKEYWDDFGKLVARIFEIETKATACLEIAKRLEATVCIPTLVKVVGNIQKAGR